MGYYVLKQKQLPYNLLADAVHICLLSPSTENAFLFLHHVSNSASGEMYRCSHNEKKKTCHRSMSWLLVHHTMY